jgi:hypothetical protein
VTPITLDIPVRTVSEANRASSEHWRMRHKRAKHQRRTAAWVTRVPAHGLLDRGMRLEVRLTRISPRPLDDDNLASSMKHVRDGVADALGINDRDPRVTWTYGQERRGVGEYAVRITIKENGQCF